MRPTRWTFAALILVLASCAQLESDAEDAAADLDRGGAERDIIGVIDTSGARDADDGTPDGGGVDDADGGATTDCVGANLRADPDNCGRCGNRCDPANGVGACVEGTCVIESCSPGFGDCDGVRANGCETSLSAPDGCRSCLAAGAQIGGSCGRCAGGVWRCDPGGQMVCAGEPTGGANACGGCEPLDAAPGESCGTCDSGTWACASPVALVCAGDLGSSAQNACGECGRDDSCDPGDSESGDACPGGRPEVRLCGDDCRWGAWSCEPTEAVCAAGTRESEDEPCGSCAEGRRTRERSCASDGSSWSAWSAWSSCVTAADCGPGDVDLDTRACSGCGPGVQTRERACNAATCAWGSWSDWSTCSAPTGECSPGERRVGGCADCLEQVCTSSCTWSACQLAATSECDWQGGSNWRCCATGWQFCLRSCRWSTDCAPCSGCGC